MWWAELFGRPVSAYFALLCWLPVHHLFSTAKQKAEIPKLVASAVGSYDLCKSLKRPQRSFSQGAADVQLGFWLAPLEGIHWVDMKEPGNNGR